LQTFVNHATFFTKVLNASSLDIKRFLNSPYHLMSLWTILLMFEMKMCCIIGWIGPLCLYPRPVDPSQPQRKCILLLFMPWSMFVPRQGPLLWIYLHP
jgi:hypothetical protein